MKKIVKRLIVKYVLLPLAAKHKGDVLHWLRKQPDYRNHVVMSLYKTQMGWMSINRALQGMGMPTVKCYYRIKDEMPHVFFDVPTEARRKELPAKLVNIVQPNEV